MSDLQVGDRVAFLCADAIASVAHPHVNNTIRIPDDMSFAEAAAIPTIYWTALYSLVHLGRLKSTDKVLIHSAAGGTGQAMLQVAQWIGAEVFVTVGNLSKKEFLMEHYGIADSHIFSSRDDTFAEGVRRIAMDGVDVIVNSLSGSLLEANFDCIASCGAFWR